MENNNNNNIDFKIEKKREELKKTSDSLAIITEKQKTNQDKLTLLLEHAQAFNTQLAFLRAEKAKLKKQYLDIYNENAAWNAPAKDKRLEMVQFLKEVSFK